jgi:hypothetical protein
MPREVSVLCPKCSTVLMVPDDVVPPALPAARAAGCPECLSTLALWRDATGAVRVMRLIPNAGPAAGNPSA